MSNYEKFFLMDTESVKKYTVEVLHFFEGTDNLQAIEIGDGNINYVFKVWDEKTGRSVIVKQADRLLRSSGRPLDMHRNKIEAEILSVESRLAPEYVPEVYHYDETMAAISMEDISQYKNLRKELMENRIYPHLSENISNFLADSLLPTTDLVMDRQEKKKAVRLYINPELCDITEDLVLTEPYYDGPYVERNKNIITKGNEDFVLNELTNDEKLKVEVAKLRNAFMNNAQALIHGDLHSGSIFANEDGIKVIDPEFAFYGPMGYDIGNVIGNLFFSLANKIFTMPEEENAIAALEKTISEVFDMTAEKLDRKYDEIVEFPFYTLVAFKKDYLENVMADSIGFAGTEIIRRVVGDSKVMEVTSVHDLEIRIPMERALILLGKKLIMNRFSINSGVQLIEMFNEVR